MTEHIERKKNILASIIKTDAAVTIKVAIELFPVGRRLTLVLQKANQNQYYGNPRIANG